MRVPRTRGLPKRTSWSNVTRSRGDIVAATSDSHRFARAFKTGQPPSRVATAVYTLTAWAPTMAPGGGTYTSPQTVTLSTTTAGATIRYSTSGGDPTEASSAVTGPLFIPTTTTLKAAAFKPFWSTSAVSTAVYTMNFGTLAPPTISPGAGSYTSSVTVTLTSGTPGATIRYTTNGTTPTPYSTL